MYQAALSISLENLPTIISKFYLLTGMKNLEDMSRKHFFYDSLSFYEEKRDKDWNKVIIPVSFYRDLNAIQNFLVLEPLIKKIPAKVFLKVDMIKSLCVEAMVGLEYLKRGYVVNWLSVLPNGDPPDLVITHNHLSVDFEIKCRKEKSTIESMFDAMSRGLQSLKSRKSQDNPAVIVVHNGDNLNWEDWLKNPDVQQRLNSRFVDDEYRIISGVIFSGGGIVRAGKFRQQYGVQFVAFRSNYANVSLPYGFLSKDEVV